MTDVHTSLKGSFVNTVVSPLSMVLLSLLILTAYLKVLKETFKKSVFQGWREAAQQLRG